MDIKPAVDISSRGAENFVKLYYSLIDTKRHLLPRLYRQDTSRIVWNGTPLTATDLGVAVERMGVSEHRVTGFDCHPIMSTGAVGTLMVNVSGTVSYGVGASTRKCVFSQMFVLRPDPAAKTEGNFYVADDCFRWV